MTDISNYMSTKHHECEDHFSMVESSVEADDWANAQAYWQQYVEELELHIEVEESILFPEFEKSSGMTNGPTKILRLEHGQISEIMTNIKSVILTKNKELFSELSQTLRKLMQQHYMREEQILYPMGAHDAPDTEQIMAQVRSHYSN